MSREDADTAARALDALARVDVDALVSRVETLESAARQHVLRIPRSREEVDAIRRESPDEYARRVAADREKIAAYLADDDVYRHARAVLALCARLAAFAEPSYPKASP